MARHRKHSRLLLLLLQWAVIAGLMLAAGLGIVGMGGHRNTPDWLREMRPVFVLICAPAAGLWAFALLDGVIQRRRSWVARLGANLGVGVGFLIVLVTATLLSHWLLDG